MPDNRHIHGDNRPNRFGDRHTSFQFNSVGTTFLDQATCIAACLGKINLVRKERHIGNDQGMCGATRNGAGVIEHFFHRHRQGVVISGND